MTTISSAMLTPLGAADTNTSPQDLKGDGSATTANAFAQLLAGMLGTAPKQIVQPARPEGLSELDAQDTPADAQEKDGTASSETNESAAATVTKPSTASLPAVLTADAANDIVRSLVTIDPALQAKVSRVVKRMHEETGHDVQVTETFRSQSRQNALYAQGREIPGQVVTWTRHSKHTDGRAVDVTIDGGKAGSDAYATLQRIATEEGLRTLGARDPGHLELPGTTGTARAVPTTFTPAEPADASGPGAVSVARVAQIAQVARVETVSVARPAAVARVAQVATPGQTQRSTQTAQPTDAPAASKTTVNTFSTTTVKAAQTAAQQQTAAPQQNVAAQQAAAIMTPQTKTTETRATSTAKTANVSRIAGTAKQTPAAAQTQTASTARVAGPNAAAARNGQQSSSDRGKRDDQSAMSALGSLDLRGTPRHHFSLNDAAPVTTVSSAERTARIMEAFDASPARPLSQITMSVDAGNGQTDRIQVAMRGNSVGATIDAADAGSAQQMIGRTDDLVRALNRDGLDLDQLTIRAASANLSTANTQSSSDSSNNSRFERGNPWQQDGERQRGEQGNRGRQQQQQQYQPRDEREETSK